MSNRENQIFELAQSLENTIRYDRVVDILRDGGELVTEEIISHIISELEENNITVVHSVDEEYDIDNSKLEDVIPADVNITQRPMNVYNLMERLENQEIDLAPDFQRRRFCRRFFNKISCFLL